MGERGGESKGGMGKREGGRRSEEEYRHVQYFMANDSHSLCIIAVHTTIATTIMDGLLLNDDMYTETVQYRT